MASIANALCLVTVLSCGEAWFVGHKSTVTKLQWVDTQLPSTRIVPFSCAVVEASVPPCRSVRQIKISPTAANRVAMTAAPGLLRVQELESSLDENNLLEGAFQDGSDLEAGVRSAKFGWWWDPVTVTRLITRQTVARADPTPVVTFSVRGCSPTVMPFNLPLCPTETLQESPTLQTADVGVETPSEESIQESMGSTNEI